MYCGVAAVASSTIAISLSHPVMAASKQAGAIVFQEKGCQHCHGAEGIGTDRGPDLSSIGKKWKKQRIEQQIVEGGGGMPAFGSALQPDEVASLVEYLHGKRKPVKKAKPSVEAKPSTDDSGD